MSDILPDKRILIITGEGKGKTTSALGMALRASGHEQKVCIIHFVKSRRKVGEVLAISKFLPFVEQHITGLGFLPKEGTEEFEKHRAAAVEGLRLSVEKLKSGMFDLVILDEICWALHRNLIEEKEVLLLFDLMKKGSALVMTGRYAKQSLIDRADTVTEMVSIKHAYESGVGAQAGIEK